MLDEYGYRFQLGKAAELRTGRDVVLISTGLMTMRALQAAQRLEADHVDVSVLHVPTIKPLDRAAILKAARTDRLVVTLENHTVIGGLSEAVVRDISGLKNEPEWMLKSRLKGLQLFQRKPMPTWGADLSDIDFDNIKYFVRSTEKQAQSWEDLPEDIRNTYEKLGIPIVWGGDWTTLKDGPHIELDRKVYP